jgi:NADH-quinone oxidoreductase subunit L
MNELIILLPLLGAIVIGLGGLMSEGFRKQEALIGSLATLAVAIPFLLILLARLNFDPAATSFDLFGLSWMKAGSLEVSFSYNLDELGILMGMVVTGVGALIHMYSIGYMHGDEGYYKYFAYLNLFIFAMLNLILGDNMVVMFLGWEGVGLCSYLLIGFWYQDMAKSEAAQKAFVANRIGDFAMLIAMFMVFREVGSLDFSSLEAAVSGLSDSTVFWIALLVFIAATGKSAQIPLFVWLPDAMAGPTPVSALIHAATMVTSGIYLIARMSPLFSLPGAEGVMILIGIVAALTAIIAALTAVAQNDIKKVLAYSTVSQLGFMFMALAAGAYTTAIFHVMTHAFFKACLFLGSGSVIHAMDHMHTVKDPQDIRTMGGLRKYLPSTGTTFWISTLAISGIPLLSGFFSKDEILANVFLAAEHHSTAYFLVWGIGILTAFLTAFYMTRLAYLTFEGEERFPAEKKPHESPASMTIPLWVLAILAVAGGYVGLPYLIGHGELHLLNHWLGGVSDSIVFAMPENVNITVEIILIALSSLIAIGGVLFARNFFRRNGLQGDAILERRFGGLYTAMENKFYFDELYQLIIIQPFEWLSRRFVRRFDESIVDGAVTGTGSLISHTGELFRKLQTGIISHYVVILAFGIVAMMAYLVFG